MSADLMFVLNRIMTGEHAGWCQNGQTYPHHPNLQAAVEQADREELIAVVPPDIPYKPYRWKITSAGRGRLDVLWKANGRYGFDAPNRVSCESCDRTWTFPGDTIACSYCTEVTW
jgi:hypothetical protein